MHALIQVLRVNESRSGVSKVTGKPWEMQDAECILLNDDGTPSQVGVLNLPKELLGKVQPGTYTGSFTLRPNLQTRRIEAQLTGLNAIPPRGGQPMQQPQQPPKAS